MRILFLIAALSLSGDVVVLGQECPRGDMDGDCRVDGADIRVIAEEWLGAGGADMWDFGVVSADWLEEAGPVAISEFMASNGSEAPLGTGELLDEDGRSSDWIEIWNFSSVRVDLSGWYLTDDANDLSKWEFPLGLGVEGGGYLVVFASEKDRRAAGAELHTNFKLDAGGEYLALVRDDGETIGHDYADCELDAGGFGYARQERNVSYGMFEGERRYFSAATPGAANSGAYKGVVEDTKFSVDRGLYDTPVSVEITSSTADAIIMYTLDGSEPSESHGEVYSGPAAIGSTTVLRAMAWRPGWMATNVDTQTYIIGASEAMKSLPVISLVGDEQRTFYGPDGVCYIQGGTYTGGYVSWAPVEAGDYNNPMGHGRGYERAVSVELIEPGDNSGFQEDCGVRVSGSTYTRSRYRVNSKFSFRLYFRNDYGKNWLDYPLIPSAGVDRFRHVVLRAGQTDKVNPFVKDELGRRLQRDMSGAACTGTFVNVYINGEYKGYYNPCERIDEEMMQTKFGSDAEWDVVMNWRPEDDDYGWKSGDPVDRPYRFDARDGDMEAFGDLLDYALGHDLRQRHHYAEICDRVDVEQFVDYLILSGYCHHDDWPHNNWTAARERSEGELGKWRFYVWDIEHSFKTSTLDKGFKTPGSSGGTVPLGILYEQLLGNAEFKQLFADRVQRHLFNAGALTEGNVILRFEELRAVMAGVLPNMNTFIRDAWAPQRPGRVVESLKSKGLFTFEGPRFEIDGEYRHGGEISAGAVLTLHNPGGSGVMYYTLDGGDPRRAGSVEHRRVTLVSEGATKKVHVPDGPMSADGFLLREYWTGIGGGNISSLRASPDFPDNPSGSELIASFETPTRWGDYYGTRVRGYLVPAVSGDYTFWLASDDNGELWLSSDGDPANVSLTASVGGWTYPREWDKYSSQESAAVRLAAGRWYYVEALQKDGSGGDHLSVAWTREGDALEPTAPIGSEYLSSMLSDWTAEGFDDSGWVAGAGGVGYETNPGGTDSYDELIGMDVYEDMFGVNASCYVRVPFGAAGRVFSSLTLRIKYDDGFAAYLNGVEVARSNFAGEVYWDSRADVSHGGASAIVFEEFDLSEHIDALREGPNVLAICGLNYGVDDRAFLVSAELAADEAVSISGGVAQEAIEYTGPVVLDETARVMVRTLDNGFWSGLNEAVFYVR